MLGSYWRNQVNSKKEDIMKFTYSILLVGFLLLSSLWNITVMAQSACMPQVTTETSLVVTWDVPAQPLGVILTGYILERQMDSNQWMELPPPSIFENTAPDSGLQVWHSYFYRLRFTGTLADGSSSTSDFGTMSITNPPCVTVVEPPPPLDVPQNLQAIPQ